MGGRVINAQMPFNFLGQPLGGFVFVFIAFWVFVFSPLWIPLVWWSMVYFLAQIVDWV